MIYYSGLAGPWKAKGCSSKIPISDQFKILAPDIRASYQYIKNHKTEGHILAI